MQTNPAFPQMDNDADDMSKLEVYSVDSASNTLYFTAKGESVFEQRSNLNSAGADNFFVQQAKEKLLMNDPAINDRQGFMVDTSNNRIVVDRNAVSKSIRPVVKVKFESF